MIKSVHDFVRRRDQTREPVAAEDLLDAVLPLIRLQAHKLRVQIRIGVEPQLPRVLSRPHLVEQCCSISRAIPCKPWTSPAHRTACWS